MKTDGQSFLDQLAGSSPNGFAVRFSEISTRLGLGVSLNGNEVSLLYEAAFSASLCNIAFNGLGGCGGEVKPSREVNRISLEREFMTARDRFWACEGWHNLTPTKKESICNIFFRILVTGHNMAWWTVSHTGWRVGHHGNASGRVASWLRSHEQLMAHASMFVIVQAGTARAGAAARPPWRDDISGFAALE